MSSDTKTQIITPLACDMAVIDATGREQHVQTIKQLLGLVQEIQDLDNGYALRLPNDNGTLMLAAKYMTNERLCCPFFDFTLELKAANGPLWLHLSGQEGVKQFLQAELGQFVPLPVT